MSGGSYDYFCFKMDDAIDTLRSRHPDQPHVLALADHLAVLSKVMRDIEWADSGDTTWDAELDGKIRAVLQPGDELGKALDRVRDTVAHLQNALAELPMIPPPAAPPGA